MILTEDDLISITHLPIHISEGGMTPTIDSGEGIDKEMRFPDAGMTLYDVEKELIRKALEQSHGNKSGAARLLHITRDALRYKIKKYSLE